MKETVWDFFSIFRLKCCKTYTIKCYKPIIFQNITDFLCRQRLEVWSQVEPNFSATVKGSPVQTSILPLIHALSTTIISFIVAVHRHHGGSSIQWRFIVIMAIFGVKK